MNFDNPVYRKTTTSEDHCIINDSEPVSVILTLTVSLIWKTVDFKRTFTLSAY